MDVSPLFPVHEKAAISPRTPKQDPTAVSPPQGEQFRQIRSVAKYLAMNVSRVVAAEPRYKRRDMGGAESVDFA